MCRLQGTEQKRCVMLTLYHFLITYKITQLALHFFLFQTYKVDISKFQYIQGTGKRQNLTLGLALDSYNIAKCLSGALGSFQCFMDKILRGLSYVTIYLDDILIHSADEGTHLPYIGAFLYLPCRCITGNMPAVLLCNTVQ